MQRMARPMQAALAELDLSDEQRQQIDTIADEAHEARQRWMQEHAEQLRSLQARIREAREAENEEELAKVRQEMRQIMADAPKIDVRERVQSVLSEEQQQRLAEVLEEQ